MRKNGLRESKRLAFSYQQERKAESCGLTADGAVCGKIDLPQTASSAGVSKDPGPAAASFRYANPLTVCSVASTTEGSEGRDRPGSRRFLRHE